MLIPQVETKGGVVTTTAIYSVSRQSCDVSGRVTTLCSAHSTCMSLNFRIYLRVFTITPLCESALRGPMRSRRVSRCRWTRSSVWYISKAPHLKVWDGRRPAGAAESDSLPTFLPLSCSWALLLLLITDSVAPKAENNDRQRRRNESEVADFAGTRCLKETE